MKKYRIRVRLLTENICCGFIVAGDSFIDSYVNFTQIMASWKIELNEFSIISIGEL